MTLSHPKVNKEIYNRRNETKRKKNTVSVVRRTIAGANGENLKWNSRPDQWRSAKSVEEERQDHSWFSFFSFCLREGMGMCCLTVRLINESSRMIDLAKEKESECKSLSIYCTNERTHDGKTPTSALRE